MIIHVLLVRKASNIEPLNRVLVTKPYNKTPYELLHGRTPSIGFMRHFGCLVTILNTLDSLGKFKGKVDEGFLDGYSINSKAYKVFNSRTRIVQETLHVNFLENKPTVVGSGPIWLFDIDSLTRTMNYQPVIAGNQTNPSAASPIPTTRIHKDHHEEPKRVHQALRDLSWIEAMQEELLQFKMQKNYDGDASFDGKEHDFDAKKPESEVILSPSSKLEDITYSDDENDVGAEADFNNLETSITVNPIPTTRIHKDHPVS
nr:retrovirus-related Pol polyprotein from transposon TNT 1-94 [Tanacetum cinerariifolium]